MENNLTPLLTITARVCQSCGLPMPDGELFGTHGDGHPCTEYCRNCFQNGLFTAASLEEVRKSIAVSGRNDVPDLSTLKRWMPAGQQASWILTQCGYVTLSTVDGNGYPRPVAIDVLRHDGIAALWMTTSLSSEKVKHLRSNPKAGISFVDYMGHYFPQGPDDPEYCILCFHSRKATLWIDRKFSKYSFGHE